MKSIDMDSDLENLLARRSELLAEIQSLIKYMNLQVSRLQAEFQQELDQQASSNSCESEDILLEQQKLED